MVMVDKLITQHYQRKKLGEIFIHLEKCIRLGTPPRRGVEKPEGPSALQPTTEYGKMYSHLWVKLRHDILNRDFIKHIF